jgi:hypothetical protein
MIAAIDTEALLELMWAAPLAVLTVTVAYGLVINGVTRATDARRDGQALRAGAWATVAVAGAGLFLAAVAFGLIIMVSKD